MDLKRLVVGTARFARRATVVVLALLLLLSNARLVAPAAIPAEYSDVQDHLRFVRSSIDDNLGSEMQSLFPEGYFFTYVLYGLSWINVGLSSDADAKVKAEALAEARFALSKLDSPAGRAPFSPNLDPSYGVFYVGWSNYLRSGIINLADKQDQEEIDALADNCNSVIDALDRAVPPGHQPGQKPNEIGSPFLASYPGQAWPVDMYPAMVSIIGCEKFVVGGYKGRTYAQVVSDWLELVDAEVDPRFGLVGHRSEPFVEHPRATSQTLILRFLAELDSDRAEASYPVFRQHFQSSVGGLPVFREHPFGVDEPGDVDSGPLVFGATASGTVVSMATAQANGDQRLASALQQQARAGGFPIRGPGGTRYAFGVLPIGDLFVIWARTSRLWFQPDPAAELGNQRVDSSVSHLWRLPIQLFSLVTAGLAWLFLWPGLRDRWQLVRRKWPTSHEGRPPST